MDKRFVAVRTVTWSMISVALLSRDVILVSQGDVNR